MTHWLYLCLRIIYPTVKITSGLSNISFGMPYRKIVNLCFLTIAVFSGMDSAIMDPCNKDMLAALLAAVYYFKSLSL